MHNLKEVIELYLEDEDARVPPSDYRPMVAVVKVVGLEQGKNETTLVPRN